MIAETAYNVIQALTDSEKERLYKMLKRDMNNTVTPKRRVKSETQLAKEHAREMVANDFKEMQIKNQRLI